jgi:hypothetical protein
MEHLTDEEYRKKLASFVENTPWETLRKKRRATHDPRVEA